MSLISCSYCKSLHARGTQCKSKPRPRQDKDYNKIYNSYRWQKLRGTILKEVGYSCGVCGRQKGIVPRQAQHVHHIVYLTEDISKAYERENLLAVCGECHTIIHNEKLNSKEKIENYFSINLNEEIYFLKE